jgi:transcription elongation GreA/GreB family factor
VTVCLSPCASYEFKIAAALVGRVPGDPRPVRADEPSSAEDRGRRIVEECPKTITLAHVAECSGHVVTLGSVVDVKGGDQSV